MAQVMDRGCKKKKEKRNYCICYITKLKVNVPFTLLAGDNFNYNMINCNHHELVLSNTLEVWFPL